MAPRWPQDGPYPKFALANFALHKICPSKCCVTQKNALANFALHKFALANFALRKICPGKFCVTQNLPWQILRKLGQDSPRKAQDGLNMGPIWPKIAPRCLQDGPRWPKIAPRMLQQWLGKQPRKKDSENKHFAPTKHKFQKS